MRYICVLALLLTVGSAVAQIDTLPGGLQLKRVSDSFYVFDNNQWRVAHGYWDVVVDAPRKEEIGRQAFLTDMPVKEETWDPRLRVFLLPKGYKGHWVQ